MEFASAWKSAHVGNNKEKNHASQNRTLLSGQIAQMVKNSYLLHFNMDLS